MRRSFRAPPCPPQSGVRFRVNNAKPYKKNSPLRLAPLAGIAGVLLFSCMATPPSSVLAFDGGTVRAADSFEAEKIEEQVARLRPLLLELLPDTGFEDLEVWVQESPSLYSFQSASTADAEGLWSPSHRRIMLSRHADHMERTLAHEMTHAVLGESWTRLPGSLEEGLADHVSASLVEDGATRLRAGRLSSACLATGGLNLDLDVVRRAEGESAAAALRTGWSARVRLKGETEDTDPMDVFRLSAGLSSTRLDTGEKRGYYGLAFLVVSRIVEREGYAGLQALCQKAKRSDRDHVSPRDVLRMADLGSSPEEWRQAAASAMGKDELIELVRMYPDFLVNAIVDYLQPTGEEFESALDELEVRVGLADGTAAVSLDDLPFIRQAILDAGSLPKLASAQR